mmetsp:Transcript_28342/g.63305  ORF Transcript_28342/g.63305 Transcript_28342/m.63305 type:complete len:261 (+) Transcript_28342:136-918(+)
MGCSASGPTIDFQLDLVEYAVVTGAGIAAYRVTSAGSKQVNGVYKRIGAKRGDFSPAFQNETNRKLWLCSLGNGSWHITDDHDDEDGGSYYSVDSPDEPCLPPTFGWACESKGREPVPMIEGVEEGPVSLVVEGAGMNQANGTYTRSGNYDGAPMYVQQGGGSLCIVRTRGNWYKWMIAYKGSIDEESGDLYESARPGEYPPSDAASWTVSADGEAPTPSVTALDGQGNAILPGWVKAGAHPAGVVVGVVVSELSEGPEC